jgi:hypothetical protein
MSSFGRRNYCGKQGCRALIDSNVFCTICRMIDDQRSGRTPTGMVKRDGTHQGHGRSHDYGDSRRSEYSRGQSNNDNLSSRNGRSGTVSMAKCAICCEDVITSSMVRLVPCAHTGYCEKCIRKCIMTGHSRCPECRTKLAGYNTKDGSVSVNSVRPMTTSGSGSGGRLGRNDGNVEWVYHRVGGSSEPLVMFY